VHTVCPRFYDGLRVEFEQLKAAYSNALLVCDEIRKASSIVFVEIGTGVYKWSVAPSIAFEELSNSRFDEIMVCFIDERLMRIYEVFVDCTGYSVMIG